MPELKKIKIAEFLAAVLIFRSGNAIDNLKVGRCFDTYAKKSEAILTAHLWVMWYPADPQLYVNDVYSDIAPRVALFFARTI